MRGWASALPAPPAPTGRPPIVAATVDWAHLVTLDFETYYDDDYTLKKLSTSEYVRDPRFQAHMVGIRIGRRKTVVVPRAQIGAALRAIDWRRHDLLCHNTAFDGLILSHHYGVVPRRYYCTLSMARGLYSNDIGAGLDEVAQYLGRGAKLAGVLAQSKGVRDLPPALFQTMAGYCIQDVDLCHEVFKAMLDDTPATEIALIDITIRCFAAPVLRVDLARVQAELARELAAREALLLSIDTAGFPDRDLKKAERALPEHAKRLLKARRIAGSNEAFAALLQAEGIPAPLKVSPSWLAKPKDQRDPDKQWTYAFAKDDAAFIELPDRVGEWATWLDRNDPADVAELARLAERTQGLIDVRLAVKSTTNITRAERFLTAGAGGLPLPMGYAYARAHTYRWGGNNKMNMQNLKRGGELRAAILAPPGQAIVVADSGQIEARFNAWLWGQDDLLADFANADRGQGRDAYCNFADLIYGRTITKADKVERFVGKVAVLGLGFQMGPPKFQDTLAKGALGGPRLYFELTRCAAIVNAYRRKNFKIVQGWAKCGQIIEDMAAGRSGSWKCLHWEHERIWGPDGTCLKYPGLARRRNPDSGFDEWTYQAKDRIKKLYGGLLCENIVQWLARMAIATQMLEVAQNWRVVLMTHDEIGAIARLRSAPKCFREMEAAMRRAPPWCADIPLNCEGGWAENYSK
jgi:DNA polymerase